MLLYKIYILDFIAKINVSINSGFYVIFLQILTILTLYDFQTKCIL